MQILKYLKEIKKILTDLGYKPGNFLSDCRNRYMIFGDIILVEAKIVGIKMPYKYGYFLIDADDKDLLDDREFIIYMKLYDNNKNFNINVYDQNHKHLFKALLRNKYPFKNKKSKHYICKNDNPLDLRKASLEESTNKSKGINNNTGKTGVNFDRWKNRWVATLSMGKKILRKYFAVNMYVDAKKMAYDLRDKWEEGK